jgi:hypothetical protein
VRAPSVESPAERGVEPLPIRGTTEAGAEGPGERTDVPIYSSLGSGFGLADNGGEATKGLVYGIVLTTAALSILIVTLFMDNWFVYVEDRYIDPDWGFEEIYAYGPLEGMRIDRMYENGHLDAQEIERIPYDGDLWLPIEGKFVVVTELTRVLMVMGIALTTVFLTLVTVSAAGWEWRWNASSLVMAGHFGQLAFWFCFAGALSFGTMFPYVFLNEIKDVGNVYETAHLGWTYLSVVIGCLLLWFAVAMTTEMAGKRFILFNRIVLRIFRRDRSPRLGL